MPIEPTIVSKSSVREVEKTSNSFSLWTSKQGSSTGGKDSPNSSIWEKAINGAQKLFGLEKTERDADEDSSDKESRTQESQSVETTPQYNGVPGFGNRGFGSFSGSGFTGNLFGTVSTSRPSSEFTSEKDVGDSFAPRNKSADTDFSRRESIDRSRDDYRSENYRDSKSVDADADRFDDEAESKEASPRPVARQQTSSVLSAAHGANVTSGTQTVTGTTEAAPSQAVVAANSEQVASAAQSVPVNTANSSDKAVASTQAPAQVQQTPNTANTAAHATTGETQGSIQKPSTQAAAAQPVAEAGAQQLDPNAKTTVGSQSQVASNGKEFQAANVESTATQTPTNAKPQLADESTPGAEKATDKLTAQSKPASQTAGDAAATSEKSKTADVSTFSNKSDSLAFDEAKAKEAVSDSLARVERPVTGRSSAPQATPSVQQPVQQVAQTANSETQNAAGKLSATESDSIKNLETEAGEAKSNLNGLETAKREPQVQQRVGNSRQLASDQSAASTSAKAANEANVADAKAMTGAQTQAASQNGSNAREAASVVASRVHAPVTNGRAAANSGNAASQAVAGTSAAGGTAATGANLAAQGSRQGEGQQGGDPAAKKDLGEALKQTATSKTADKGSDASQSFESRLESSASSRRSEAASKARQTSYVSKTADEMKEVVATLTKSIDRLVSTKPGTMNLKLNFEGGGSLNLRISMEGNQISTSMQTDVAGLESAIKSNWSELSNEWNQKGVKLNLPQFQNSEVASGRGNSDDFNGFSQRGDRNADARGSFDEGHGRGRTRFGAAANSSGNANSSAAEADEAGLQSTARSSQPTGNQELKAYA